MSEFVFCTGQYASGDWDSAPLVPANIIDSVARYTSITVSAASVAIPVDSRRLLGYPLVYLTGHLPVRFTEAERRILRELTRRGGMVFMDDHNHDIGGIFHQTATEEIARTWGPLRQLSNDHRLYSTFFRFDGPPTTTHELNGWGDNLIHPHLSAVLEGDRIAVLYSNKDYSSEWNFHPANKRFLAIDNTRFGVNIVVYALTH